MFYLMAFLTMLAGLLIYMLDPVPSNLRNDLSIRQSEALVVDFVNQHQAALDYLSWYEGRISPRSKVQYHPVGGGDRIEKAHAFAVPAKQLSEFMGVASSSVVLPTGSTIDEYGSIQIDVGGSLNVYPELDAEYLMAHPSTSELEKVMAGGYASAVVCLNSSRNLAPCYKYMCPSGKTGAAISGDSGYYDSCTTLADIQKVFFRDTGATSVTPYLITYSDSGERLPAWWDKYGNKNVSWRRAFTNRTHASPNCGFIQKGKWKVVTCPPPAPGASASEKAVYVSCLKSMRKNPVVHDGTSPEGYCLNNGVHCTRLIETSVLNFLSQHACANKACTGAVDLNGVFFCISPLKDPYHGLGTTVYHYDGHDPLIQGGTALNTVDSSPVSPTPTTIGSVSGLLPWYPLAPKTLTTPLGIDGTWNEPFFSTENEIVLPMGSSLGNQTLIVVFDFGSNFGDVGRKYIGEIGTDNKAKGAYALYSKDGQKKLYLATNAAAGRALKLKMLDNYIIEGVHSLAIVQKAVGGDYKVKVYFDGVVVPGSETMNSGSPTGNIKIKPPLGVASIRYYDTPLTDVMILKNFKVDALRFGAGRLVDPATLPSTPP